MRNLLSMSGRELTWAKPRSPKRTYRLFAEEFLVAELTFKRALSWTATATTGEGSWEFQRKGLMRSTLHVCESGPARELAAFQEKAFKRIQHIVLLDGSAFTLCVNSSGREFTLLSATGETLAVMQARGFFRRIWSVEIRYRARSNRHLLWLVPFMWYYHLIRRSRNRHQGAAAG